MPTAADFSSLPRNLAMVVAFNTAIAGALAVGRGGGFLVSLLYSQCIGLCILLIIDVGRRLVWGRAKAPTPAIAALAAGGIVGGFLAGSALAGLFVEPPYPGPGLLGRGALGSLALTLFAGTAATFYFLNRERLAELRLRTEMGERGAAEARLKLLQAQIEPHFLFNTLANLHSLIGVDPARAQRMLEHLNDYLRATLDAARRDSATLGEEFNLLRGYLEVIAIRMGARLAFGLSLPDALAGVGIPPMLLQPLVENAIKHGLEPKVDGGRLEIVAFARGSEAVIEIADTGLGLGNSSVRGTNVGLEHVRGRLAAAYGGAATLELRDNEKGGATATIRIPLAGGA